MEYEIVMASLDDREEILSLYKAQLGRDCCPWTDEYPSDETISWDLSRDALFVMKKGGRIVAAVSIDEDEEVDALPCWNISLEPEGELARLAVLPDEQNKGLGRIMLQFGMDELKRRGCKGIHILVNRNNTRAIRCYAVFGFSVVGECHMYDQDLLCYEKGFNAGTAADKRTVSPCIEYFLSPDVPEVGPGELTEMDPPGFERAKEGTPSDYPGGGLSRYSMLYVGEGDNTIYLVHDGKIAWRYRTGKGWELDDIWMLDNGSILFTHMYWVGMVTPGKELIWRWDCPPDTEVHTLQPAAENEVVMLVNGKPPRLVRIRIPSGEVLWEKEVPCSPDISVHGQFRRMRITKDGTFLIAHLSENKVSEYDPDMREIWRYEVKGPWAAERLSNGNTLVTAEAEDRTIETDPSGRTVWQIRHEEIPEPYRIVGSQSCVRLPDGNTILCSRGNGGKSPQLVEVTPEKEVVWCIHDFKNLGPATSIQIL